MTTPFNAESAAEKLITAHETLMPAPNAAFEPGPQNRDDAYQVQANVIAKLGANGGFKTARPDLNAPNIMAPILAQYIRPSPGRYTAREMRLVGIEIEIAFLIREPLPTLGATDYDDELRKAVSVLAAIEMVDSRLADRDAASDLAKLADNQSGFGLVTGAPVDDFAALNLTNPSVSFEVNGVQTGPTLGQIPGEVDAFGVLKDFLAAVGDHCGGISPGQFVTTGALTGLHWAAHGDHVTGRVDGIGEVAVTIVK